VGDDADGMRLDNYLMRVLKGVPRSHVYRLIRSGQVRVGGGRARPANKLVRGDEVRVPPVRMRTGDGPGRPPDGLLDRVRAAIAVVTEDWLLCDKPAGLAVHAGSGVRFGVIEVLRADRPEEHLELVHRLDRDTSGCLLVARHREALVRLRRSLRDPATEKTYLTLLAGHWRGGAREVDAALARDLEIGGERVSAVVDGGKPAHSRFVPLERFRDTTLVEVTIATGRTHQIRVHAAHLGHPVAGDRKYGNHDVNRRLRRVGLKRMFLHAWRLDLPGMDGPLSAPLPEELEAMLQHLRDT
jgi:23S rRNA pseudouridine955/2504/2580 synthase